MTPDPFAPYLQTLARGPGKSRALTRDEARTAFAAVLAGHVDPHQVGAFLLLLRYRGEDADEITGLVEAARTAAHLPAQTVQADLDWPSYGSGQTRGAPWFLLAALTLARHGHRVLMHGTNEFSTGLSVADALGALGMAPARNLDDAARQLDAGRFAYLPLDVLSPELDRLVGLRTLFGLRSPVNTVVRLLDPANARAGVDGVFHPAYLAVHLGVAERLVRPRYLVLKGGGGEAERNPAKPATAHAYFGAPDAGPITLPALDATAPGPQDAAHFAAVWDGARDPRAEATVIATIALGLIALGDAEPAAADAMAADLWSARRR